MSGFVSGISRFGGFGPGRRRSCRTRFRRSSTCWRAHPSCVTPAPAVQSWRRAGLEASISREEPPWHQSAESVVTPKGHRWFSASLMIDCNACAAVASWPGMAWALTLSVVDARWWSRRSETTGSGIPAASISVAMKWRRSWRRNSPTPAAPRYRTKVFVTRFGFHAATPPSGRSSFRNGPRQSAWTGRARRQHDYREQWRCDTDACGYQGRRRHRPGVPTMQHRVDEINRSCQAIGPTAPQSHSSDGQDDGRDGQTGRHPPSLERDETPAPQGFRLERTTRFELATLTLAR